jgi:glycosyltransferase involved in cell wall biosynthesis
VAARIPVIATAVGGVPEIFGPNAHRLISPDDPARLARTLEEEMAKSVSTRAQEALALESFLRSRFDIDDMVDAVIATYGEGLRRRGRKDTKTVAALSPDLSPGPAAPSSS